MTLQSLCQAPVEYKRHKTGRHDPSTPLILWNAEDDVLHPAHRFRRRQATKPTTRVFMEGYAR